MLKVDVCAQLHLWKAEGFFQLLDDWQNDCLDIYRESKQSFVGTSVINSEIGQNDDRSGCYVLFFRKNSKFYVGSGKRLSARTSVHVTMLRKNKHYNEKITKAFEDNGSKMPDVLFIQCHDHEHAKDVEQRLVDLTFDDPYSLNQLRMVNEYRPTPEETRGKIKQAAITQWRNPEFLKKIEKVYQDPEVRARKSAAAQEVVKRPEYLKKISVASKRMWQDPEYAANQKVSGGKIWLDDDFRKRHSEAMKAKWANPEYKRNVGRGIAAAVAAKKKPLSINGVRYEHAAHAAKDLGVGENTVRRRCASVKEEHSDWLFI